MENYKENLESAKEWYKIVKEQNNQLAIEILETIFPELVENEDEKIRKAIFKALSKKDARDVLLDNNIQVSEALSWLEKQKKQKPIEWSEEDEKMWLSAIEYIQTYPAHRNSVVNWLKSLKERLVPIC